jgi:hypothetical protein
MGVIVHLLHEGLLQVEQEAERLSEGVLRVLLIAIMIVLATLHPTIGIILICAALLRYGPVALTRTAQERFLTDAHRSASDSANATQAALRAAEKRVREIERDLIAVREAAERFSKAEIDPAYHAVGLHEGAPTWLIESARKAYRLRLHPDRHPAAHKAAAHEKFVMADAKFAQIYARRGMRG